MTELRTWTIQIALTEDERSTRADALLTVGDNRLHAWGRSRRNPSDPDVPRIGEEVAVARALSHLAHQLLDEAADAIEAFEGGPVAIHP